MIYDNLKRRICSTGKIFDIEEGESVKALTGPQRRGIRKQLSNGQLHAADDMILVKETLINLR
jgi:hypothetical protein